MSKHVNEDEDDITVDQCDCCKSSMTTLEFAYLSDEDRYDVDIEIANWLNSMKYNKLCHKCLSALTEKTTANESRAYEELSEVINKEAKQTKQMRGES